MLRGAYDFELEKTIEPFRAGEPESDGFTRCVLLDKVADGAVSARGTGDKGAVERHVRPGVCWPQPVLRGGKRVDERAHSNRIRFQLAFMVVEYFHFVILPSPAGIFARRLLRGIRSEGGPVCSITDPEPHVPGSHFLAFIDQVVLNHNVGFSHGITSNRKYTYYELHRCISVRKGQVAG
ncbi:hypothetical protein [Desulfatitalea tepidiphila]|uniref:hypothetical protein n=1 Tax=Desulfatitalea tepidiphila TaxID=1185843 RepID=UPI0006B54766|nr:hypothetical protein [Desulfatitalea tepidiphila]